MSAVPQVISQPPSLLAKIAGRYSVEPAKMLTTLKQTAFRQREGEVTNEQMMALLIVADQHKLNPFLREIYAFPDKNNGVVPVVGVDGWARIINEHQQFDGMEFVDGPTDKQGVPEWIECVMHRKDRAHPTRAREYLAECRRGTQPWQSHPRRMLRHKAMIQCARLAFSFTGIFDEDEAQRIAEATTINPAANDAIDAMNQTIVDPIVAPKRVEHAPSEVVDVQVTTQEVAPAVQVQPDAEVLKVKYLDFRTAIEDAQSTGEVASLMEKAAGLGPIDNPDYKALHEFASARIKALAKAAKADK
jgi:phage recombination protein Bet